VKRILDGRTKIPLAYDGKSQFQTSSVEAIADSVVLAADGELSRIANVCDADSPTVVEIGKAIVQAMNGEVEFVGLNDCAYRPVVCATALSVPKQFTVVNDANWKIMLPQLAQYPYEHFDYSVDDAAV